MHIARTACAVVAVAGLTGAAASPAAGAGVCENGNRTASSLSVPEAEAAFRCELGAVRRDHGLGQWSADRRLADAARRHAADLVRRGYFSHRSLGGQDVVDRVSRTGYFRRCRPCRVGETLAWGTGRASRPAELVRRWLASPPHRAIVLADGFDEVGVGVAHGTPDGSAPEALTATLVVAG